MKKAKKKTTKKRATKASKPGHMSMTQLLGQLAKALSEPLDGNERRTISLRIAKAKQTRTAKRKR
jgi:hypothetical protein